MIPLARCGYYFVWRLSEAAHIASGFAYNGMRGKDVLWDRVENVEILKIEFLDAPRNAATVMLTNNHLNLSTGI